MELLNTDRSKVAAAQPVTNIDTESAVRELMNMRSELTVWILAFQEEHGRPPRLQDARNASAELHDMFGRYSSLLQAVRRQD